ARTAASTASAPLVRVAAATGGCSGRLVLEFAGRVDGYDVRYVPQVLADASGRPVPVAGGARLKVTVVAPAYDASGTTFLPGDPVVQNDARSLVTATTRSAGESSCSRSGRPATSGPARQPNTSCTRTGSAGASGSP